MGQMTKATAEAILNGYGATAWEVEQLARFWLAAQDAPEAEVVKRDDSIRLTDASDTTAVLALLGRRVRLVAVEKPAEGK